MFCLRISNDSKLFLCNIKRRLILFRKIKYETVSPTSCYGDGTSIVQKEDGSNMRGDTVRLYTNADRTCIAACARHSVKLHQKYSCRNMVILE